MVSFLRIRAGIIQGLNSQAERKKDREKRKGRNKGMREG